MSIRLQASSRHVLYWVLVGLVLVALAGPFLGMFSFLALIVGMCVIAVYAAVGLILLCRVMKTAPSPRSVHAWTVAACIPVSLACLFILSPFVMRAGSTAFVYARFAVLVPLYSHVLQGLAESPQRERDGNFGPITYEIDPGPPIRVVFPHFGGIIDNWVGTIYDPSDTVSEAKGWMTVGGEQAFTAPPPIRGLFGGDIVECRRLYGHFYSCVFT